MGLSSLPHDLNVHRQDRRDFLNRTVMVAGSLAVTPVLLAQQTASQPHKDEAKEQEEEVSPNEDLMREHGLLNRVLLVYEEAVRRIESHQDIDPASIKNSAQIIRNFI